MTEDDFHELGVTIKGHMIRLRDAVNKLKIWNREEVQHKFHHKKRKIIANWEPSIEEKFTHYYDLHKDTLIEEKSKEFTSQDTSLSKRDKEDKLNGKSKRQRHSSSSSSDTKTKNKEKDKDKNKKDNFGSLEVTSKDSLSRHNSEDNI